MNYYAIEANEDINGLFWYWTYSNELTCDPSKACNFDTEDQAKNFMKENNIYECDFHVQKMYKGI